MSDAGHGAVRSVVITDAAAGECRRWLRSRSGLVAPHFNPLRAPPDVICDRRSRAALQHFWVQSPSYQYETVLVEFVYGMELSLLILWRSFRCFALTCHVGFVAAARPGNKWILSLARRKIKGQECSGINVTVLCVDGPVCSCNQPDGRNWPLKRLRRRVFVVRPCTWSCVARRAKTTCFDAGARHQWNVSIHYVAVLLKVCETVPNSSIDFFLQIWRVKKQIYWKIGCFFANITLKLRCRSDFWHFLSSLNPILPGLQNAPL